MNGKLDITPEQRKEILSLLSRYLPGVEVWAFGSRVKWTSRLDSDLDIAAFSNVEQKNNIINLREAFADCSLPFRVDLHVWQELPENFKKNIKAKYIVLQEAKSAIKTLALDKISILEELDHKIKVNWRMNKTLDEMIRAIFKSWFIDFDPVRRNFARSQNQFSQGEWEPVKEIDRLFPGSFQDSELGQIPRGWEVGNIKDFASLNPENLSNEIRPKFIKYVDLSNTKWGNIQAVKCYTQQNAPKRAQRVLRPGDTIIGTVRPSNGSYAFISTDGFIGSTAFAALRPRKCDYAQFVYLGVTAPANIERLSQLSISRIYPSIRPEVIVAAKIIRPDDKILAKFSIMTNPMFVRMAQNQDQSRILSEMRNTLMPLNFSLNSST